MRILVSIGHPADFHLFKNLIWILEKHGHEIKIAARDKDVLLYLLNYYGLDYVVISTAGKSLLGLGKEMLNRTYWLFKMARDFKPDIIIAVGDPSISMVGKLLKVSSITFSDTEHSSYVNLVSFLFTDVICTPSCYKKDIGKKQIRYNGYKELAYLHPNYFKPAPRVLDELGLSKGDKFFIVRFVSWDSIHDVGQKGFDADSIMDFIKKLGKYGRVLITSEAEIGSEFDKYKVKVTPEKLHDLLYYANLYIGEGGTMATEAAVLGTSSIYVSSLVGTMGNFIELGEKYGLIFSYNNPNKAINKALELIQKPNLKEEWQKKRELLLKDKIDVTAFMVWFIENYPESFKKMKENPMVQEKFR